MDGLRTRKGLLLLQQLPLWRQENPYILGSYRPLTGSYSECLRSLAQLHNETMNVYTHLLGLGFFIISAYTFAYSLYASFQTATYEDAIVFSSFFFGLFTCLISSAGFHTFLDHSKRIYDRWLLIDFLGILSLIAGSWVPGVYYGFYCQRQIVRFYLTMVRPSS